MRGLKIKPFITRVADNHGTALFTSHHQPNLMGSKRDFGHFGRHKHLQVQFPVGDPY